MWSNKYIGIPFKDRGRDHSGVDCWGLARLVYKQEFGIDLPSFDSKYTVEDSLRIQELIAQYKEGWDFVSIPEEGNIVLFRILGRPMHVGVMINNKEFLHSREGYDVAIGSLDNSRWNTRVVGYYKYSEKTKDTLLQLPAALETKILPLLITEPTTLKIAAIELTNLIKVDEKDFLLFLNDNLVDRSIWNDIQLQTGDKITYRVLAGGDDVGQFFKLAALIVISYYAPGMAEGLGFAAGSAGAKLAAAAITIASAVALNYIFPVRPPVDSNNGGDTETTLSQLMAEGVPNAVAAYQAIPVVLGKVRVTPPLAAQSYITYPEERISYLTIALAWGFGPLYITNQKIGETNIGDYVIKDSVTLDGFNDTLAEISNFDSLYARDVEQPSWNPTTLVCDGNPEVQVNPGIYLNPPGSSDIVSEVAIAFHMPQGMRRIKLRGENSGTSEGTGVVIQTEYKFNNSNWTEWETFTINGNNKDAYTIVRTKTFPQEGLIQVRARRLTGDNTEDNPDYRYMFDVVLLSLTYTSNRNPIKTPPNCTLARSVYVIQASDQLSGRLEGINAIVQSRCRPVFDTATSDYTLITSNPAALFLHVLTHPANPQKIELNELETRINMPQIQYWYNYCDTLRTIQYIDVNSSLTPITRTYKYEYNSVLGQQRSVLEVLRDICAAGRASPSIIDGKWTVTIDEPKSTIVQHFSPHNSWGFEAVRSIPKEPDGLKITFFDEEQNYQETETIVYNIGKNYSNAVLFESINLPGITNRATVVDHAKWHFAQLKLRREVYTLNCDIEYLACNRGDRVKVTHDVPAWGIGSGRIKNIYLNNSQIIKVLELDEAIPLSHPNQYTIRIRSKTGQSTTSNIITQIPFSSFTRVGNLITIPINSIYGTIPFDNTNPITIVCNDSSINIQNTKVTIDRQNNTISYTIPTGGASQGYNPQQGFIQLTQSFYKYILLSANISNNSLIDIGDLFLLGELDKESQDLVVLSIEPMQNKSAKITLIDYGVTDDVNIFEDYKSLTEDLVFETQITLPPKFSINSFNYNQIPIVTATYSDDRAVDLISPGVYKYNIKISYATTSELPTTTKYVQCEYTYQNNNDSTATKFITTEFTTNTITIPDVIKGEVYKYRLRYVTIDNIAGSWTAWEYHTVTGIVVNREQINELSVTRIGKVLRVTPKLTNIPNNFKYFRIKIFKDEGQTDFWNLVDPNILTISAGYTGYADFNILDFSSPRISETGTKYRVQCKLIDTAGNESTSSISTNITLYTISP